MQSCAVAVLQKPKVVDKYEIKNVQNAEHQKALTEKCKATP